MISRMMRLSKLAHLIRLKEEDPESMEYKVLLREKRSYNYGSFRKEINLNYGSNTAYVQTSTVKFEMSRDFLFPKLDVDYRENMTEADRQRREEVLRPLMTELFALAQQLDDEYIRYKEIKIPNDFDSNKF